MTFTLQIDDSSQMIPESLLENVRIGCQAAMANRFASIVHNNFGFGGEDRPQPWPELGRGYADEFHGGQRIPTLILSGDLQRSIQIEESNPDFAAVWTDNEYALDHQYGNPEKNLRARPFFPIVGDSLTPYSEAQCIEAANNHLVRTLNAN